ncbi:uncharacterized protein KY384_008949 [Bacidia gigantensis]|uniref:uncharacterized protein n=1 Tax=Bacidia gigantensis TaxID=2732470 RepID=UPI001D05408A|nr:uncharacterized protein KY384_008949 [Bacidia gigantensis]KAG8525305.1 hypothetical protein KY384_008949 [Bacidia gigantensis]
MRTTCPLTFALLPALLATLQLAEGLYYITAFSSLTTAIATHNNPTTKPFNRNNTNDGSLLPSPTPLSIYSKILSTSPAHASVSIASQTNHSRAHECLRTKTINGPQSTGTSSGSRLLHSLSTLTSNHSTQTVIIWNACDLAGPEVLIPQSSVVGGEHWNPLHPAIRPANEKYPATSLISLSPEEADATVNAQAAVEKPKPGPGVGQLVKDPNVVSDTTSSQPISIVPPPPTQSKAEGTPAPLARESPPTVDKAENNPFPLNQPNQPAEPIHTQQIWAGSPQVPDDEIKTSKQDSPIAAPNPQPARQPAVATLPASMHTPMTRSVDAPVIFAGQTIAPNAAPTEIGGSMVAVSDGSIHVGKSAVKVPQVAVVQTDPPLVANGLTLDPPGKTLDEAPPPVIIEGLTFSAGPLTFSPITSQQSPAGGNTGEKDHPGQSQAVEIASDAQAGANKLLENGSVAPESPKVTLATVGNQAIVGNAASAVVAGQTIVPNAAPITVDGTPISLGKTAIQIGSNAIPLPTPGPDAPSTNPDAPLVYSVAGQQVSANGPAITISGMRISIDSSGLIVGSQTIPLFPPATDPTNGPITPAIYSISGTPITANGPAVTISGTRVSLGSSGLVIGSQTIALPTSSADTTLAGETFKPLGANVISIDGQTISVGGPAITDAQGTRVSLATDGLVVGSATYAYAHPLITNGPVLGQSSVFIVAGETITADGHGGLSISRTKITNGGSAATIHGTAVSLGADALVVGNNTISLASISGLGPAISGLASNDAANSTGSIVSMKGLSSADTRKDTGTEELAGATQIHSTGSTSRDSGAKRLQLRRVDAVGFSLSIVIVNIM